MRMEAASFSSEIWNMGWTFIKASSLSLYICDKTFLIILYFYLVCGLGKKDIWWQKWLVLYIK